MTKEIKHKYHQEFVQTYKNAKGFRDLRKVYIAGIAYLSIIKELYSTSQINLFEYADAIVEVESNYYLLRIKLLN